jgi:hypothetical protein
MGVRRREAPAAKEISLTRAVDRLLAPLVSAGFVRRGEHGYAATAAGEAVFTPKALELR